MIDKRSLERTKKKKTKTNAEEKKKNEVKIPLYKSGKR